MGCVINLGFEFGSHRLLQDASSGVYLFHPYENKLFLKRHESPASQHPTPTPVYEVGYDSRGHYYHMKLVQDTTLRETLDKIKRGVLKRDFRNYSW